MRHTLILIVISISLITSVMAKDELELETTIIKGNKELPQILYLVPWKDMKKSQNKEQQIVLFSLFGDIFDPVAPVKVNKNNTSLPVTSK